MAKAGFPANLIQQDAAHYVITPWSFSLGVAEVKAMASASGSTTVMDVPIRFMPGGPTTPTNYALGMSWVGCDEAFNVGLTVNIVNDAGTLIAGASGGVSIDGSKNIVPLVPVNAAAGTSYDEAYLRLTLASSNFAAQTTGSLRFIGHFLTLPPAL